MLTTQWLHETSKRLLLFTDVNKLLIKLPWYSNIFFSIIFLIIFPSFLWKLSAIVHLSWLNLYLFWGFKWCQYGLCVSTKGELFLKHIAVWRVACFEAHMEPDFGSRKVCWNFAISINGASSCVDFVSMNPDKEQTFSTSIQSGKSFNAN